MTTLRALVISLGLLVGLLGVIDPAAAQDPGLVFPNTSEASDDKAGSVLFYNLYTSTSANPAAQDTRISLTNTSTTSAAFVRLFFVDGNTGGVAGTFRCLSSNQTASFNTSQIRPDVTGYLVAIAVDGVRGCPMGFNFLTGNAHVKLASGFRGTLGAVAVAAQYAGGLPGCDANSVTASIAFNGVAAFGYNRISRVLHLPDIASRADGNRTFLVINRIGGNLGIGASTLGTLMGFLYDDAENVFTHSFSGSSQFRSEMTNSFPATAPPFETVIPAGRTGWGKYFSQSDIGLLGSAMYAKLTPAPTSGFPFPSKQAPAPPADFFGAANLRSLTLASAPTYVIPITPPTC